MKGKVINFLLVILIIAMLAAIGCSRQDPLDDIYTQNIYPGSGRYDVGSVTHPYDKGYFRELYVDGVLTSGTSTGAGSSGGGGNVTDHGSLTGLADDDHTQYLLVNGGRALTGNLDFAEYKAIALVCDNGATVPAAPTAGQWFLHTPTGRKVLMQYDGTNWINIISIGAMTMYVNGTDGSDAMDKGGAEDAGAFDTIQYCIDRIPGLLGGSVSIYIAAGTYTETVTFRGKMPTGGYAIYLYGELTELAAATAESKVQGDEAVQGSLTDTGAFGAYDNKLVYITAANEYRLIDSDTADVATVVGGFTDATNLEYKVYGWGTIISGLVRVYPYSADIYLYYLNINIGTGTCLYPNNFSRFNVYGCWIQDRVQVSYWGNLWADYSYFSQANARNAIEIAYGSFMNMDRSKVACSNGTKACLYINNATVQYRYGSICDGETGAADDADGIQVFNNGAVTITNSTSSGFGYCRIRNCDTGIYSYNGGQVTGSTNNQYSGNDTDESATAASYGYID